MVVYTLEQRFAKWACDRLTEDADFGKKKSSFQMKLILILAGKIAKRVTVLCGFWCKGIIGTFFFVNVQGEAVTVNGDRYRAMLNEFLFKKLKRRILATFGFNRTALRAIRSYTRCFVPCF